MTRPAGKDPEREAQEILERVRRESESIGTSSMARASRTGDARPEPGDDDPIEILGRRIGRTLGYAAVAALVVYLVMTYVL